MRPTAAARRYARALFGLALESGELDATREQLDSTAQVFASSPELRDALMTPLRPAAERKAVLEAVAEREGLSVLLRHFFGFLIDQRRLLAFDAIREEFVRLADEHAGLTTATVVSAADLDSTQQDRLAAALSERTGKRVRLDVSVDPDLLGGVIAKVGDLVFDGSLRTQLGQLRANLTKESSR